MNTRPGAAGAPRHQRKLRNYLLDVRLQLRYTMTVVIIAVCLTAGLGFGMYRATRDISKVITLSGMADPTVAAELGRHFAASDSSVLWGIVGFGLVLVISISAVGIVITHKVAGPLFKVTTFFERIRENRLGAIPGPLRKGDELKEFFGAFREMHQALRDRAEEDARILGAAVAALEAACASGPAAQALDDLRQLQQHKQESLKQL